MQGNLLGWIVVLIISGGFIAYFIVNCSHNAKYMFEGQGKRSRFSLPTQHKFIFNRNWTILLTVNNAYFDFFRNWYLAYLHLNISYPLVVVAEDELVHKNCYHSNPKR